MVPRPSAHDRNQQTPPETMGVSSMANKYRERYRMRQTILIDESNISDRDTESEGTRGVDTDIDTDVEDIEMESMSKRIIQPDMKDGGVRLGDMFSLRNNMPDLLLGSSGLDYEMDIMGGRFDDDSEEGQLYDVPPNRLRRADSVRSTRSVKFRDLTEIIHIDDDVPGSENFSFGVKNVASNANFSLQSRQPQKPQKPKTEKSEEQRWDFYVNLEAGASKSSKIKESRRESIT